MLFLTSDSPRKFWHKHVVFLILLRRPLYVEKRNSPNGSNSRFSTYTMLAKLRNTAYRLFPKFSVYYQTKNIPENTIFYSMNPSQHLFLLSCISSFQLNCLTFLHPISSFQLNCLTFLHPIYPQHSSFSLASYCNPIPPCIVTSE